MRAPKKIVIITAAFASSLSAVGWFLSPSPSTPIVLSSAVPVRVVNVVQQDVSRVTHSIGSVASLHTVNIRPQVNGVLTNLFVEEGQWVQKGALLAAIDDRSILAGIDLNKAKKAENLALLDMATIDLERYRRLLEENGVSRQVFDRQNALVNQLKAKVQGDQAVIEESLVQLSHTLLRSPVAGRAGMRQVDVGSFLRAADPQGIFSVTQIDPIAIEFSLPQAMLPTLHNLVAVSSPVLVKAYADANYDHLLGEGKLSMIDNQVSAGTGTIRLKAMFNNTSQKLWPGQAVTIGIQTAVEPAVLVVPPGVVQRGLDGHFVYRAVGGKAELVAVQLVLQEDTRDVIKGVQVGDVLISSGQSRLKPGSVIRIVEEPLHNAQDIAQQPRL